MRRIQSWARLLTTDVSTHHLLFCATTVWQKRLPSTLRSERHVEGRKAELFNHRPALITFCNHLSTVWKKKTSFFIFFTFFPPYPEAVAEFGRKKDTEAFCQERRITRFKSVGCSTPQENDNHKETKAAWWFDWQRFHVCSLQGQMYPK